MFIFVERLPALSPAFFLLRSLARTIIISMEISNDDQATLSLFTIIPLILYFAKIIFSYYMYQNKKVIVVLPAYNAALTLEKTIAEIPK
ncbi:MAG: hypothetical protein ABI204_10825, partial [Ginsengibacter sp.]